MYTADPMRLDGGSVRLHELLQYAERQGLYSSAENLAYYCDWVFAGVPLEGSSVLDIGCGHGLIPMYAACRGARRAVGLEPEQAGAAGGMMQSFRRAVAQFRLHAVEPSRQTVEEYARRGERFDVVTLCQVINHLDEDACMQLHREPGAQNTYRDRLRLLHDLVEPGGWLVVTDCGRRNVFRPWVATGLPHPFVPSIEWNKHQEPRIWMRLLEAAGFRNLYSGWRTPNRLRRFSWALGNGVAARCLTSEFRITARRPA